MSNPLLDAALYYATELHWPVFPCRADKSPCTPSGVLDATTDPRKIREWWSTWPRANIGLDVAGAGMMVLDLDPGHNLKELERNVGPIPKTHLKQKTPRGGEHWFFEIAEGEIVSPSASKLAPSVDVRSFHSYVLLAPSRTSDGVYEFSESAKPAFRTDEMVRVANSYREKHRDRDHWLIEPDLPENVASAIKWLKEDAKIAVEGHGGDAMAYATAAHLKSFGISEELAFDLMWEHWNPRCSPPWSSDEIDHLEAKVRNGYSYNTSPPGNITPAYRVAKDRSLFQAVQEDRDVGREATAGRFRIVDRAALKYVEPPTWLVHDLLPKGGYGLLIAPRSSFKTFVALDVALSIASGVAFPWPGMWGDVVKGNVLFAAGEGRPGLNQRIEGWEKHYHGGKDVDGFYMIDPVPRVTENVDPFINAAMAMCPEGYSLTVLDTVGRSMQGVNENAQEHASAFTALVERIQRDLGGAVLALHHTGHGENGRARGSSVFEADADTIVRLERTGNFAAKLTMTKQKDAPEWDKPRALVMETVKLGKRSETLVCTPGAVEKPQGPSPSEAAPASVNVNVKQKAPDKLADAMIFLLDKALADVLQSNPSRRWSQAEIAEAVAAREGVDLSSVRLRKSYLVTLRETKGTIAHRCYDPLIAGPKKWRWIPEPKPK